MSGTFRRAAEAGGGSPEVGVFLLGQVATEVLARREGAYV